MTFTTSQPGKGKWLSVAQVRSEKGFINNGLRVS